MRTVVPSTGQAPAARAVVVYLSLALTLFGSLACGGSEWESCGSDRACELAATDPDSPAFGGRLLACLDGRCVACDSQNHPCEMGQHCSSGVCIDIPDFCYQSGACRAGLVCVDGQWLAQCGPACPCRRGQTCSTGGHCEAVEPAPAGEGSGL